MKLGTPPGRMESGKVRFHFHFFFFIFFPASHVCIPVEHPQRRFFGTLKRDLLEGVPEHGLDLKEKKKSEKINE